jgi:predicted RNase H-like HicB family nuclease
MEKTSTKSEMKTYIFDVDVVPDEDRWFARCPALENRGAATWGYTREEALKNLREVIEMTVEGMIEDGESIPEEPGIQIFLEPRVAITI